MYWLINCYRLSRTLLPYYEGFEEQRYWYHQHHVQMLVHMGVVTTLGCCVRMAIA